jgi:hypothetical protein
LGGKEAGVMGVIEPKSGCRLRPRRAAARLSAMVCCCVVSLFCGDGPALGSVWTRESLATSGEMSSGQLSSVSCSSGRACTAVGAAVAEVGGALVERWDGTRWSAGRAPRPRGSVEASLSGVSCPSARDCVAVGSFLGLGNPAVFLGDVATGPSSALVERWDGTGWSVQRTPTKGLANASLAAVSCLSANECTAVGSFEPTTDTSAVLVERWDGNRWSIDQSRNPPGFDQASLSGVSCTSPTACAAVGALGEGSGETALIERWNGARWSRERPAKLHGSDGSSFSDVSCTSRSACVAVGGFLTDLHHESVLTERWDGSSWKRERAPELGGGPARYSPVSGSSLARISCTSSGRCIAIGSSVHTLTEKLVERWNGRRWSLLHAPNKGGNTQLSGVSCPSITVCVAVGDFRTTADLSVTLAERLVRSRWSIDHTPNLTTVAYSQFNGVSCPSPASCTAVGELVTNGHFLASPLVEARVGSSWSLEGTPPIGRGIGGSFSGVSCPSPSVCVAVGETSRQIPLDVRGTINGQLAEGWNGRRWTVQSAPSAVTHPGELNAVDCVTPTDCLAVGRIGADAVTEIWNGASWAMQAPAAGSSLAVGGLNGLSCPSASDCVAVGISPDGDTPVVEGGMAASGRSRTRRRSPASRF